jgi:hypothetical protein
MTVQETIADDLKGYCQPLQNRFRLKCVMEFGILRSEDRIAGFSGWERKRGYGQEDRWLQLILW